MNERKLEVRDGLKHRCRDSVWLLIDLLDGTEIELVPLLNTLEPFQSAEGSTNGDTAALD